MNKMKKRQNSMGLYINFPFCPSRCHYCSFGSRVFHHETVDRYLSALKREIRLYGERPPCADQCVNTIYLGGGTPTLIADELPGLLKEIKTHFDLGKTVEVTLEAYPAGVTLECLSRLAETGFNRISFGVQSFLDADLLLLNREHSAKDVYQAYDLARKAGFININLDLIYGLPGQTLSRWEDNLSRAIALNPEHLSIYGLTLEEKTYFDYLKQHGKFMETGDEIQAGMYLQASRRLRREGYIQYEVSNFTRPGFECLHNLHYWTQGNFLGLGASASSYFEGTHASNISSIEGYIRQINESGRAIEWSESLNMEARFKEALIFGLRKCSGIKLSDYDPEYKEFFGIYRPKLLELSKEGLLRSDDQDSFRLTEIGLLHSDHISVSLC